MNQPFVKGLDLCELFYAEAVKPILAQSLADIVYSAALIRTLWTSESQHCVEPPPPLCFNQTCLACGGGWGRLTLAVGPLSRLVSLSTVNGVANAR